MNTERMHALTRRLIGIDSVTGREAAICRVLADELEARGLNVRRLPVDGERFNLLATWPEAPAPAVLFTTHVDTVPEQYGPHEDDNRIYGRGAADTHGVLAAQLEAVELLRTAGVTSAGLLLLVGEESGHDGARAVAGDGSVTEPDILVVGEPSENLLLVEQKGVLKATVTAVGLEGHSGYPERYRSATELLLQALLGLQQADWLARASHQGTTVNVARLAAAAADNKVPDQASARLMFRCAEPWQQVRDRAQDAMAQAVPSARRHELTVAWDAAANDPVTGLGTLPGFDTGIAAFNTDIAYLDWRHARTFLAGPGSMEQGHRDLHGDDWEEAEWIDKSQQQAGVALYVRLVRAALGIRQ